MDRLFKRIFFVVLALVLVLALLGIFMGWMVGRHFTPEKLVSKIEENFNCRAHIDSCDASIFGGTALKLSGLQMGLRDEAANAATPLGERKLMAPDHRILSVESVDLTIDLGDLLGGKLKFKNLVLGGLDCHVVEQEDGTTSFKEMFRDPAVIAGKPNPAVAKIKTDKDAESSSFSDRPKKKRFLVNTENREEVERGFGVYAKELRLPTTMDRLEIISGHIRIDDLAKGRTTRFRNLHLVLTHIKVDPTNLSEDNHCFLDLDSQLMIEDLSTGKAMIDFNVLGTGGEGIPFDPETGLLNPIIEMDVEIAKGSKIDGHPLLKGVGHALEMAKDFGIDLGPYSSSVVLSDPASGRLRYENQIIGFQEEVILPLGLYGMGIGQESWIDPETDSHHFNGFLALSESATESSLEGIAKYIKDKVPANFYETALSTARTGLLDEDRRIRLQFESESYYDDPKVKVIPPFNAEEAIQNLLGDPKAVEGLLKGLLGN